MTATTHRLLGDALEAAIAARVTPGAVVEVGTADGVALVAAAGRLTYGAGALAATPDTVYDLASLTKVMATTTIAMQLVASGALTLDTLASDAIPAFVGGGRETVAIADLLAHCAGLPAHRPLFRRLAGTAAYRAAICAEPLAYPPRSRHEYSDLGYMLLGDIVTAVSGRSLRAQFDAWRDAALPGVDLWFGPVDRSRRPVAPTEAERWRGRTLVGHVHDANAAALGGAAGHAGLFGTAAAVGAFARWYLHLWRGHTAASAGIPSHLAGRFATRGDVPGSSRALGWDTMLPTSSCGPHFSPAAIGHTGFTGTSLWIDPVRGAYVVLLTNRVHPTAADADGIRRLRRAVHDAVACGWPA
ncbi:MAG: serine hydrolase domain-containing protein [Vicinamibacterales bacterium]